LDQSEFLLVETGGDGARCGHVCNMGECKRRGKGFPRAGRWRLPVRDKGGVELVLSVGAADGEGAHGRVDL
jgi:hypothetical protein